MKRHTAQLALLGNHQTHERQEGTNPEPFSREQLHIARLTQGLISFLSDSADYFQKIVSEVRLA